MSEGEGKNVEIVYILVLKGYIFSPSSMLEFSPQKILTSSPLKITTELLQSIFLDDTFSGLKHLASDRKVKTN